MADKTRPSPRAIGSSTANPTSTDSTGVTEMKTQTETKRENKRASSNGKATLTTEVIELVQELRDAVRRINPRRESVSSLRRSLVTVTSILDDIQAAGSSKDGSEATASEK